MFVIFIAVIMFKGIVVAIVNFKPCICSQVIDSGLNFQNIPKYIFVKQASQGRMVIMMGKYFTPGLIAVKTIFRQNP